MYIDRVRCEYCGRINPVSEFDCRGCGAGLMTDPIKEDNVPWRYSRGFADTMTVLCSMAGMDSDSIAYYGLPGQWAATT